MIRFLGAVLRNARANISLGQGASSRLTVSLVGDPKYGYYFENPVPGTPVSFSLGSFNFQGFVLNWRESLSKDGLPTYEVELTDPRELLAATAVILNHYQDITHSIPNLLNVFGYAESKGFGLSLLNEGGMPWSIIGPALTFLTSTSGVFGGPISWQGYTYKLDLSQVPNPGNGYRINENLTNVSDIIARIMEDTGHDWFCELVGRTIRVRTISRRNQPPTGSLKSMAESVFSGNIVRSEYGIESRLELTSSFLVGGEKTYLYTNTPLSYWGIGANGVPVFGEPGYYLWKNKTDPTSIGGNAESYYNNWPLIVLSKTDPTVPGQGRNKPNAEYSKIPEFQNVTYEMMNLNATPIADILGSTTYRCSDLELCFALTGNETDWLSFMQHVRPDVCARTGIVGPVMFDLNPRANLDFIEDRPAKVLAIQTEATKKFKRFYDFVLSYAREFYGKVFAVQVGNVLRKIDPETQVVSTSDTVAEGAWSETGIPRLSRLFDDVFKIPDGRYKSTAMYRDVTRSEISKISPRGTLIEGKALFTEVSADNRILYTHTPSNPSILPYVIITLPNALYQEETESPISTKYFDAILAARNEAEAVSMLDEAKYNVDGSPQMRSHPAAIYPDYASIALKAERSAYGPWYSKGVSGATRYEQDDSLVPWNFGSEALMNLTALARVSSATSQQTLSETASIEVAGNPIVSLGDAIVGGGPQVTGIDIGFSDQGITTTYRFTTFSPKFGIISKNNLDRITRINKSAREAQKIAKGNIRKAALNTIAAGQAKAVEKHMDILPNWLKRQSPHQTMMAQVRNVAGEGEDDKIRTSVSALDAREAIYGADNQTWPNTTVCGMEMLFRPFSAASHAILPTYEIPSTNSSGLNSYTLDPFTAGTDFEIISDGESFNGVITSHRDPDWEGMRGMALRGPLVVNGWGYDTRGNLVGESGNYKKMNSSWAVGPVDMVYDRDRGVWTSHDFMRGKVLSSSGILSGSTGEIQIKNSNLDTLGETYLVRNGSNNTIKSGEDCYVLYDARSKTWFAYPNAGLPQGEPYTVLHVPGGTTSSVWSGSPIIQSITLGYSGSNEPFFALENHEVSSSGVDVYGNRFYNSPTMTGYYDWILPENSPSGVGILSGNGSDEIELSWINGISAGQIRYVHSIACVSGNLVFGYKVASFENGILKTIVEE